MKVKQYTMDQLAVIALEAGIPPWPAVTCVAIGWAESRGNAYAVGINDYDPTLLSYLSLDLGVWGTNTYWHSEIPIREALDPKAQIVHVNRIARKSAWQYTWSPWNTYVSGSHLQWLPQARISVRNAGGAV